MTTHAPGGGQALQENGGVKLDVMNQNITFW